MATETTDEPTGRNLYKKLSDHPVLAALIAAVIVASGGTFRLNQVMSTNESRHVERCEQRNMAWDRVMDFVIESGGGDSPDLQSRERVERLRELGLVDCEGTDHGVDRSG